MKRPLHQGLLASLACLTGLALAAPAAAQERFKPAPTDRLVASVHAQAGRDGSLRSLDQAWRADPKNLDAAMALARASDGDARAGLNLLEALLSITQGSEHLQMQDLEPIMHLLAKHYDRAGDFH
jgi:replication-associated recombination protein RarA